MRLIWIIMIVLLFPESPKAQAPNLGFRQYSLEEGLSQTSVRCILEDGKGFIWLGTADGLNRFDSHEFKVYKNHPEHASLADNTITALLEDEKGALWIGTMNGGLNLMDAERMEIRHIPLNTNGDDHLNFCHITALARDDSGTFWVGTRTRGLFALDSKGRVLQHYQVRKNHPQSLSGNQIHALMWDNRGRLWIGSDQGLDILTGSSGALVPQSLYQGGARDIKAIFNHSSQGTWLISNNHLYLVNHFFEILKSAPLPNIGQISEAIIQEDESGGLWMVVNGQLHAIEATLQGLNIQEIHGTPVSLSLLIDSSNRLLLGSMNEGLFLSNVSPFKRLSLPMPFSMIKSMKGSLLIASADKKVFEYHPATGQLTTVKGVPPQAIYSIHEDPSGTLMLGTHKGLFHREDETQPFSQYGADLNLGTGRIFRIYRDSKHTLWVGDFDNGLYFQEKQGHPFKKVPVTTTTMKGLSSSQIMALHEDAQGRFWVGTLDGGLNKLVGNGTVIKDYRRKRNDSTTISHNAVACIFEEPEDHGDVLWIGTRGGGLNRLHIEKEVFTSWREIDGLPNNTVYGIQTDHRGHLWLSTNRGLSQFNPDQETFVNFDIRDGLPSNEFNTYSFCQDLNGIMYFGGVEGVVWFNPQDVKPSTQQPPVTLTHLKINHQTVSPKDNVLLTHAIENTQTLVLKHNQNTLGFEFTALDYSLPEKNQYAYMLDPFETEWVQTSAENRRANYTNIPHGSYRFRVKATNKDGVWSKNQVDLHLKIQPPWHQTILARSFFSILIVSLALGSFWVWDQRRRLAMQTIVNTQLKELNLLKDDFLANTSHELRTPLHGIIGIAESLLDGATGPLTPKTKEHLSYIHASGLRLNYLVNDILDFSKLKHKNIQLSLTAIDLHVLVNVAIFHCQALLKDKNLRLMNMIPRRTPLAHADENRVLQILYNLIGNAIKFTESGSVEIDAAQQGGFLHVKVKDTGIGIELDQQLAIFQSFEQGSPSINGKYRGTGLGLTVSRQLVELHKGTITVASTPGQGSVFTFTLPISSEEPEIKAVPQTEPVFKGIPFPNNPSLAEEESAPPHEGPTFKVLVVDDEPVNRQILSNYLNKDIYLISSAPDGRTALELVKEKGPFDIILLDVMMPGLSGYDTCKTLRKTHPSHQLPIIFLTARNQIEDIVNGFNAGGNDFITKPIAKPELLARVETQLTLLHANRDLDKIVQLRTLDLEKNNRQLQFTSQELETSARAIRQQNNELTSLLQMIKTINQETSSEKMQESLLRHGMNLFPSTDKALFFSKVSSKYCVTAAIGCPLEVAEDPLFTQDALTKFYRAKAITQQEGVYLNMQISQDEQDPQFQIFCPVSSLLTMTVTHHGRLEAVVMLFCTSKEICFSEKDADRMERFREHAVNALNRAWFFHELDSWHTRVEHSLQRAEGILKAIQPPLDQMHAALPQHFLIFKPQHRVSGDFFQFIPHNNYIYLAVADCGLGIDGALASVLAQHLLSDIFKGMENPEPLAILNQFNERIHQTLSQSAAGINLALNLCRFDMENRVLLFTGATLPLFIARRGNSYRLNCFEGSPFFITDPQANFSAREFTWSPGDRVYLATDGLELQMSADHIPLGRKGFQDILASLAGTEILEQKRALTLEMTNYQNQEPPTDDMTVMGIQLT